jgi:WD40 repeat protein
METFQNNATEETHSLLITDVRFRPGSDIFATSSFDKSIRVWDTNRVSSYLSLFSCLGCIVFMYIHYRSFPSSLHFYLFFPVCTFIYVILPLYLFLFHCIAKQIIIQTFWAFWTSNVTGLPPKKGRPSLFVWWQWYNSSVECEPRFLQACN